MPREVQTVGAGTLGLILAAWLSVGDKEWSCEDCYTRGRRLQYLCRRRGTYSDPEAMRRLADAVNSPATPLARYDRAGVCPHSYVTELSMLVSRARSWWEHNGLGITLQSAPYWLIEAMELMGGEMGRALAWQAKQETQTHGK